MNTPRSMRMPAAWAEANTRMPLAGSLRESMTTSTRGAPGVLKASSFLTSAKAMPGRAGCCTSSSCRRM